MDIQLRKFIRMRRQLCRQLRLYILNDQQRRIFKVADRRDHKRRIKNLYLRFQHGCRLEQIGIRQSRHGHRIRKGGKLCLQVFHPLQLFKRRL